MKYLIQVEKEEWDREIHCARICGILEALGCVVYLLSCSQWNQPKEIEDRINLFICENKSSNLDKRGNPMLSLISMVENYRKMCEYFSNNKISGFEVWYKKKLTNHHTEGEMGGRDILFELKDKVSYADNYKDTGVLEKVKYKNKYVYEALSAIRKVVEGKRKKIPNKTMLPYRYCKTYNSALDDILAELGGGEEKG